MAETWIVYKTESMDDEGWEERKLLPAESLTNILSEEWDCSGVPPKVGDRVQIYANLHDPGNGVTHGKDGDWIVTRIKEFKSTEDDERVLICYCQYQPIDAPWKELRRGVPVDEMLDKDRAWEETKRLVESNERLIQAISEANAASQAEGRVDLTEARASIAALGEQIAASSAKAERERAEFRETVQRILDAW